MTGAEWCGGRQEEAGRPFLLYPTMRVQPIPHDGMPGRDHDLPFRIELWDDNDTHIEEVIALVSDFATAKRRSRKQ